MAAVASDAATMLAEALQKMDGLISDDHLIMESLKSQPFVSSMNGRILSLTEELKAMVNELHTERRSTVDVPCSTAKFLIDWLNSLQVKEHRC